MEQLCSVQQLLKVSRLIGSHTVPVNGYSIDLCYLFVEKSSIDPRGIRRTCYPMHVFDPYAMIWLPVLADHS